MKNRLKEYEPVVILDDDYPLTVVPKEKVNPFILFYVIVGLAIIGLVGLDIGYILGVSILIASSVLMWYLVSKATNNRLASILAGGLTMTILVASNLDDNLMTNIMRLISSLQRTSFVGIIVIGLFLAEYFRRK